MRQIPHLLAFAIMLLLLEPTSRALEMHETETRIPWTQAEPNGLSALLVYADLPGNHPLVVITHGTSREV